MQIIKTSHKNIIKKAARILKANEIIVYPTETAYGLGCDATNVKAVKKIFEIKDRSFKKPLPLIVTSFKMAKEYVMFPKKAEELANKYWPGPLMLVLSLLPTCHSERPRHYVGGVEESHNTKYNALPAGSSRQSPRHDSHAASRGARGDMRKSLILLPNQKTIALRISSNEIARKLSEQLGKPIISTSANISGQGECYTIEEVLKQLKGKENLIDLIIDAGKLPKRKPSTIVKITDDKLEVLRQGEIKLP